MIERLFTWPSVRSKQLAAPLLREREQYLSHLLNQGVSVNRVRSVATMLLHIIRLVKLDLPRIVQREEIEKASLQWTTDIESHITRKAGPCSEGHFVFVALKWLRFTNLLYVPLPVAEPTDAIVKEFVGFMKQTGLYPQTIRTYGSRVCHFLRWALNSSGKHLDGLIKRCR